MAAIPEASVPEPPPPPVGPSRRLAMTVVAVGFVALVAVVLALTGHSEATGPAAAIGAAALTAGAISVTVDIRR
ncbi:MULTISPECIES: hypothetical protein [unclassified Streptomyces]|uniref:hypothetical protein n=1 Tax=unclassified Streptomyces TaxID=2593676 RepID=UPI0035D832FE